MLTAVLVAAGCGGSATPEVPVGAAPAPRFDEVAAAAGVDHAYTGGFDYFVGGGVAVLDCDRDGWPDLYLAGGESPAALYRNTTTSPDGELRFEAVASPVTDLTAVVGAYPLDVDSDGATDLVVLRHGPDEILRNTGDCRFEPAAAALGLAPDDGWTTAFSATWEQDQTLPTLAFGHYLAADRTTCDDNTLVRPASATAYGPPVTIGPGWCPLSMLFSDWGRTGHPDLRVSNDRHYYDNTVGSEPGQEQLWRIRPGEPPAAYGPDDGWQPLRIWGMGIASQDLTGDGLPEVVLTSQGDNKLQTLVDPPAPASPSASAAAPAAGPGVARPEYRDMALRAGATAQRPYTGGDVLPSTAWHPQFADVNLDGLTDLLITKGNVEGQTDHAAADPDNLLLGQPDGTFVEAGEAAGLAAFNRSRGAAVTDLDLDGLPDIVVVNREAGVELFHNRGPGGTTDGAGHWLALRLRQPAPNVDAVGAWVEVRVGDGPTFTRELTVGGGHVSGQADWIHIGLGRSEAAGEAEIRVRWPDGEQTAWLPVGTDRFLVLDRDQPTPLRWCPAAPSADPATDCPATL